jgi:hypothetical protein
MLAIAIFLMVVSIAGLVGSVVLNAFFLDRYNAYGEVPIPGSTSMHLPAGDVTITFHTVMVGTTSGTGLPIPQLGVEITPPPGVAEPVLTDNFGSTTTVNNDARRWVWTAHIAAEGNYTVTAEGQVSAFLYPKLAFGHPSSLGWLPWVFGGLLALGVLDLIVSIVWMTRVRQRWMSRVPTPVVSQPDIGSAPTWDPQPYTPVSYPGAQTVSPADPYTPTDEAIRIEQIKHLAALRDSGALTQEEFDAEKRRVLDGR